MDKMKINKSSLFDGKKIGLVLKPVEKKVTPLDAIPLRVKEVKKLNLEYKDLKIESEGYDASELEKVIFAALGHPKESLNVAPSDKNSVVVKKETVSKPIVNGMRERGDVLEVSESLISKARLPRTSKGFRCPHCGQGFVAKYISEDGTRTSYLFRNVLDKSGDVTLGEVNIAGLTTDDAMIIYKGLSELSAIPVVLTYRDTETCECPLCKEVDTLTNWISAYSHPLNYFNNEMLCDICGKPGQISVYGKDSTVIQCEDKCAAKILGIPQEKANEDKEEYKE